MLLPLSILVISAERILRLQSLIYCEGKTPVKSVSNDNLAQLNIKISNDLKKYYQILSINNSSTLKDEVTAALIFYKNHSKQNK